MEKVHDEDEMQIDLRELLFALKKRILIIFAVAASAIVQLPRLRQFLKRLFQKEE